jgi:hypothetical protein
MAVKTFLLGLLCVANFGCLACQNHPHKPDNNSLPLIKLAAYEQVYEGYIISNSYGQTFIHDLNDLNKPARRYWARYDSNTFGDKRLPKAIQQTGKCIDWPSRYSRSRATWVKFIGEESDKLVVTEVGYGRSKQVAEINNQIIIRKVIEYSDQPANQP